MYQHLILLTDPSKSTIDIYPSSYKNLSTPIATYMSLNTELFFFTKEYCLRTGLREMMLMMFPLRKQRLEV